MRVLLALLGAVGAARRRLDAACVDDASWHIKNSPAKDCGLLSGMLPLEDAYHAEQRGGGRQLEQLAPRDLQRERARQRERQGDQQALAGCKSHRRVASAMMKPTLPTRLP